MVEQLKKFAELRDQGNPHRRGVRGAESKSLLASWMWKRSLAEGSPIGGQAPAREVISTRSTPPSGGAGTDGEIFPVRTYRWLRKRPILCGVGPRVQGVAAADRGEAARRAGLLFPARSERARSACPVVPSCTPPPWSRGAEHADTCWGGDGTQLIRARLFALSRDSVSL